MSGKRKTGDRVRESSGRGVSRRDFIKYGALAGAAVGAMGLRLRASPEPSVSLPAAEAKTNPSQDQILENGAGKFRIDIPGCPAASANIQSVQVEDLTIDVRETTTGVNWDFRTYAPGDAHFGKATFRSRASKNSKELLQWLQDASEGKNVRKNISVIILNKKGEEARRWNLMECFPIKYDPGDYSPSSTTSVETIVVKIGHVEFA